MVNVENDEDRLVFKILIRCLKEENRFNRCRIERIMRSCYASRKNHSNEPFFVNVYYWPTDCGNAFNTYVRWFIYVAMIINSFENADASIKERFVSMYKSLCREWMPHFDVFDGSLFEFKEQIIEAFKKCGFSNEESKTRYECLEVTQNAEKKGGIPF